VMWIGDGKWHTEMAPAGRSGSKCRNQLYLERASELEGQPHLTHVENGTPIWVLEAQDSVFLVGTVCVAYMPMEVGSSAAAWQIAASAAVLHLLVHGS
jgi:hypothetical protein